MAEKLCTPYSMLQTCMILGAYRSFMQIGSQRGRSYIQNWANRLILSAELLFINFVQLHNFSSIKP